MGINVFIQVCTRNAQWNLCYAGCEIVRMRRREQEVKRCTLPFEISDIFVIGGEVFEVYGFEQSPIKWIIIFARS